MTDLSSIATNGLVRFKPLTGLTGHADFMRSERIPGYSSDGDYFDLPTSSTDSLVYVNSAGSTVYTKAYTDLHANVDQWCGFYFDGTDMWAVGVDTGTTPDTYYTATINSAGTVTAVGNAQPTTDFTTAPAWDAQGTNLWYDGSANLKLFSDSEVMSIATADGTISVDTAAAISGQVDYWVYQTTNGLFVSALDLQNDVSKPIEFAVGNSSGQTATVAMVRGLHGIGSLTNSELVPVQHGSNIWLARGSTSAIDGGARAFTTTQFDAAIERLARQVGVT